MNDMQLYLAIGVPVVFNAGITLLGFTLVNGRIGDLREDINRRFDLFEKLFTEKLLRVEQVMDARLKHLEEQSK